MYKNYFKKTIILSILLTIFSSLSVKAVPPTPPVGFRWILQEEFSDEFNDKKLDMNKWNNYYPGWQGRPPAMFNKKAVSVKDGTMQIKSGILKKPQGKYTIYGGAVTSKSDQAYYGYYECSAKASKIAMSTTFWMSNGKVPFIQTEDCDNDKYSQELDIQEGVGGSTTHMKFKNGMNSNTHYRYIKCNEKKETFISKGAGTKLKSNVFDGFHTYGAWWKDAEQVDFYADNKFFESVKVRKDISDKPFDRPMKINMVTETYDWQPAPSKKDLKNNKINTAFYDWVRSYKLVPVDSALKHCKTEVNLYEDQLMMHNVSSTVFNATELTFEYEFQTNQDCEIQLFIQGPDKKTIGSLKLKALQGFGKGEATFPINFQPEKGKSYKLVAKLNAGEKVLDQIAFDVSE